MFEELSFIQIALRGGYLIIFALCLPKNKVPEAVKSQLQNSEECYLCGNSNRSLMGLGEGKHSYYGSPNSDRGISDVTIYDGDGDVFDVARVKDHLCQTCLDKVLGVMEVYAPENEPDRPRDLCLVDFQTLELY